MTIKQKVFIKKYIENGGNGTQAALDAYHTSDANVAHAIASENLQKPTIKREIELAFERAGLNDDYISKLLREATVSGLGQKATNSDSLRGIELILKLKGAFPDKKSAHLRLEMKDQIHKKGFTELIEETKSLQNKTQQLLQDCGV